MFKIRSALAAMALFAGLAVAHAQTTQQDHDAHHPDARRRLRLSPTTPGPAWDGHG